MSVKRLIVVDGLDGCGKDMHARRIFDMLDEKGHKVWLMKHPSQRLLGRMSKRALLKSGPVAAVFATAFYTADVLTSVREFNSRRDGDFIFVRYLLGTAYLPVRLALPTYVFFKKLLPFPYLAIFLDIEPSVAIRRIEARDQSREMFETHEKLSRVRKVAKSLVAEDWVTVDNTPDGEEPFEEVRRVLATRGLL